jgi:glycosyltransferase involved in cell wall biosynthesis
MRILYVSHSGNFGGVEKHIKDLIHGMKQMGHEVYVWMPQGAMVQVYQKEGALVTIDTPRFEVDPAYIFRLKNFLLTNKIQIVHVHDKSGSNALLAGFLAKTPVRIGNVHTPLSQWQVNPIKKAINLFTYFFVARFLISKEIAVTQTAKNIKASEGIPQHKIAVIPNYVEIATKPNTDHKKDFLQKWGFTNKTVIGCVGRLSEEKGQDLLIKAFYMLSQDFKNVGLVLIGGGPLQEKLQNMLKELNLQNNAVITGVFSDEDKASLFSTIDIFAFPSRAEGFGYVPLEALALGVPTIASDLPVLQEVLGVHALYFAGGDPVSLRDKLAYAVQNYSLLKNNVADSSWINQQYGFDQFINSYTKLYEELLRK